MVKKTVTPRDLLVNTVEVAPEDSKSGSNIKNRNQSLKPPLSSRRPPVRKTRSSVHNQVQFRGAQERSARFQRAGTKWSDKSNPNLHQKDKGHRSASHRNMCTIALNCPNLTTLKDYDIQVLIGQGAFGSVQRGTIKGTHNKVAIK